jgi:hypothetical protein
MCHLFDVEKVIDWTALQYKHATVVERCAAVASTLPRQRMMRSLPVRDYQIMSQHINNSRLRLEFTTQLEETDNQLDEEMEEARSISLRLPCTLARLSS